jgi:Tol biopolymer transport system component
MNPQLTKAGDKVAFDSCADNLVTGDTNGKRDAFLKNIDTGDIQRVSESQSGQQANGHSIVLSISDDGRYVVFSSEATNLIDGVVDTNGKIDIFVKDMITKQVTRISDASNGIQSNKDSYQADISGDGSTVVFSSDADNLIEGDSNYSTDLFWGH